MVTARCPLRRARRRAREIATSCPVRGPRARGRALIHGRRGDDVLRARVHVAEQTLNRARAQSRGSGRLVHEQRHLVRRPGHVRHCKAHQRVLRRTMARRARASRRRRSKFHRQERGRAVGALGFRVVLLKTLARRLRAGPAAARSDVRGELIEQPAADAASPTRMANRRKADHADRVEAPPRRGFSVTAKWVYSSGTNTAFDPVVDAAGPPQTHHVPVVDQRRLLNGQHEDPRLAGPSITPSV